MTFITDKAAFAANLLAEITADSSVVGDEIDGMAYLHVLGGMMVETAFLFGEESEALQTMLIHLRRDLNIGSGDLPKIAPEALPPAMVVDVDSEKGRAIARKMFEEWLDCAYEFVDVVTFVAHHFIMRLEEAGQPRLETYAILAAVTQSCMAYENAAQELCDVVMDEFTDNDTWSLSESISGLSAVSGRCLGMMQNPDMFEISDRHGYSPALDSLTHVMTQEAIRLGVPAGSDWRFGLAANDVEPKAPFDLIMQLWPLCQDVLISLGVEDAMTQAVACAKATGRMLAVASGGESPGLEPAIAKPLAMAALSDTYKIICQNEEIVSCEPV